MADVPRRFKTQHISLDNEVTEEGLPEAMENESPLPTSRLNVYRVMPPGLNTWEQPFAELLDRDTQTIVCWWHRNLPHKPWSVQVLVSDFPRPFHGVVFAQSCTAGNTSGKLGMKVQSNEEDCD
jgi:hypothetical protein